MNGVCLFSSWCELSPCMAMYGTLQVTQLQGIDVQGIKDTRINIYRYPEEDGNMSMYVVYMSVTFDPVRGPRDLFEFV